MNVNLATLPLPPLTQAAADPQRLRQVDNPGRAARQRFQATAAAAQDNASAPGADAIVNPVHGKARHGLGSYLPATAPTLFRVY